MAQRIDVTASWCVGKCDIHKQDTHGNVGWRRYFYTTDGVITAVQKDE
jgi:hypothetical protein